VTSAKAVCRIDTTGVNETLNVVREPYAGKARTYGSSGAAFPGGNAATLSRKSTSTGAPLRPDRPGVAERAAHRHSARLIGPVRGSLAAGRRSCPARFAMTLG
jgi:hypothetical protein